MQLMLAGKRARQRQHLAALVDTDRTHAGGRGGLAQPPIAASHVHAERAWLESRQALADQTLPEITALPERVALEVGALKLHRDTVEILSGHSLSFGGRKRVLAGLFAGSDKY